MLFVLLDGYIIFSLIKKKRKTKNICTKNLKKRTPPQPEIYSKIFSKKTTHRKYPKHKIFFIYRKTTEALFRSYIGKPAMTSLLLGNTQNIIVITPVHIILLKIELIKLLLLYNLTSDILIFESRLTFYKQITNTLYLHNRMRKINDLYKLSRKINTETVHK